MPEHDPNHSKGRLPYTCDSYDKAAAGFVVAARLEHLEPIQPPSVTIPSLQEAGLSKLLGNVSLFQM